MRTFSPDDMDIVMPRLRGPLTNPLRVFFRSPKTHRRAVFRMAQYFRRELGYDFTQYGYDGNEDDRGCVAYVWHGGTHIYENGAPCYGAACFREREEGGPALQWVWIHPFMRRHGILSSAWELFEAMHPNFAVEFPLSDAMLKFLEDRGHAKGIKGWYVDYLQQQEPPSSYCGSRPGGSHPSGSPADGSA